MLAAPTAAAALRHCQFGAHDLLLLDLGLPDASGLGVLREVREPDRRVNRFHPRIGVIVLSGLGIENGSPSPSFCPWTCLEISVTGPICMLPELAQPTWGPRPGQRSVDRLGGFNE